MSATPKTSAGNDVGCCATAMRKASRRLAQLYDSALAPSGLKSTQFSILAEIGKRSKTPLTMQELAVVLVMDRSTLGQNLRPLERDGFVELREDAKDRRRRYVQLTPDGKAKCTQARPYWARAQEQFLASFGKEESIRLNHTLLGIAHNEQLTFSNMT